MRVLQLSKFYPPDHGGIEAVARDLSAGLVRAGVQVEVLCASKRRQRVDEVDALGVRVVRAGSYGLWLSTSMAPGLVRELMRRRAEPDIVHVHMPDPLAALAVWTARPRGRVVLHWHSDVVRQRFARHVYAPLERWLLDRADAVIATSPPYAQSSPALRRVAHKVAVIPIGAPPPVSPSARRLERIRQRHAGRRIVFALGRMTYYKGWDVLVAAARHLPEDVVVVVGGGGPELPQYRALAERAGLAERVRFVGPLSADSVEAYFRLADVFCMASTVRAEAYGVAVLEAMARGLPVVATDIPGSGLGWLHQDGVTGLRVPPGDADALARAIGSLLDAPELRTRFGQAGRARWAAHFTAETMADQTLALYRRLLAQPAGTAALSPEPRLKILLEMRPALDGHAGIPQEARLLFRGLSTLEGLAVEGLLQSSNRVIARGLPHPDSAAYQRLSLDKRIHRLSRVVLSLRASEKQRVGEFVADHLRVAAAPFGLALRSMLRWPVKMGVFEGERFQDFVWRDLFARTLPVEDLPTVAGARMRVLRKPWNLAHATALATRRLGGPHYPRLDTRHFDVMIAETPYPGRVSAGTQMVVRYHDAIPILMPHTITDKSFHQASHYHALRRNVKDGAWFACVSDATRRDLLSIFPEVEPRSLVIHNMVSHHYHEESAGPGRLFEIVRTRRHEKIKGAEPDAFRWMSPDHHYLLMVSTLEPRKNHTTLLAAWEQLRQDRFPDLKLVVVGSLGWDHKGIVKRFRPWLDNGDVQLLEEVPASELRLLYHHAAATVCPSLGEGFDFSGVEAMRCGGAVVASDIPVHREIFGDAAEYFHTYAPADLARAVTSVIDPEQVNRRAELIDRGRDVSSAYLPERVLPQWRSFLQGLPARR